MLRTTLLVIALVATIGCNKKQEGTSSSEGAADGRPTIKIKVDAVGYHPSEAKAAPGKPVRLEFTRTTEEGCGQEIVFPSLNIKKELPVNQPVAIDLTMPASGKVGFACGMDMMKGSIVAE
jgi:plastocyanin domain-containing protein